MSCCCSISRSLSLPSQVWLSLSLFSLILLPFCYFWDCGKLECVWRLVSEPAAPAESLSRWHRGPRVSWAAFKSPSRLVLLIHHAPVWVGRSVSSTLTGNTAGRKSLLLFAIGGDVDSPLNPSTNSLNPLSAGGSDWWLTSSYYQMVNLMQKHYIRLAATLLLRASYVLLFFLAVWFIIAVETTKRSIFHFYL